MVQELYHVCACLMSSGLSHSTNAHCCCWVFGSVGVAVIQFPKSYEGNQYRIVFVDYLTKWPEVFAAPDQTSLTIAQLLADHVIH